MKITIEMSLYPVCDNYLAIIKAFIAKLKTYDNISILCNNVSTQISGDYEVIMQLLNKEIKEIFLEQRSVFVIKFLEGDKINE